jgi:hypothetical protein
MSSHSESSKETKKHWNYILNSRVTPNEIKHFSCALYNSPFEKFTKRHIPSKHRMLYNNENNMQVYKI